MLTMSTVLDRKRPGRLGQDYFAYFASPYGVARTFAARRSARSSSSASRRSSRCAATCARGSSATGSTRSCARYATVIQLDLQVAAVTADVLAGRPVVYTTFLAYDEVAHHSGVERPDTLAVLRRVDRAIERIAAAVAHAPRPVPARRALRPRPEPGRDVPAALRRDARGRRAPPRRRRGPRRGRAQRRGPRLVQRRRRPSWPRATRRPATPIRTARGQAARRARARARSIPEVAVMASGNLGLISFPREPGPRDAGADRGERARAARRAAHAPGIGFVLVRSEATARSCSARAGATCSATGAVEGEDPLAPFGPRAADHVRAHRRVPALPGHRRQQQLLGGARRGRGVRGARRLARRPRRRPGAPVRAAPGRPAVAARSRSSAPRQSTASCAAGWPGSARTAYSDERVAGRERRHARRRAPARPRERRTRCGGSVSMPVASRGADGRNVPQWIGIATRGCDRARPRAPPPRGRGGRARATAPSPRSASARRRPRPRSSSIPSSRSVSPANQIAVDEVAERVELPPSRARGGGGRRARRGRAHVGAGDRRPCRRPRPRARRRTAGRPAAASRRAGTTAVSAHASAPQRGLVQVVVVDVRDQHAVERVRDRPGPARGGAGARRARAAAGRSAAARRRPRSGPSRGRAR